MKAFWLFTFCLGLSLTLQAQNYPVSTISDDLKTNSYAVVRLYKEEFEIKNRGLAHTKVQCVVTILNANGAEKGAIVIPFNKFTTIVDVEAELLDAEGKRIKRLKRQDLETIGVNQDQNSVDDSYVKVALLNHFSYPYTVSFHYELVNKNMMFYPTWCGYPNRSQNVSVESSVLSIVAPKTIPFRFLEKNLPSPRKEETIGNLKRTTWQVENLPSYESEPDTPISLYPFPMVYTAPNEFEVEGYQGNLASWADVGKFYYSLNQDKLYLSGVSLNKLKTLNTPQYDQKTKVKKVYDYLQANTRYMNASLGIGGWQSMRAEDVAVKGYGDCKGLTTYTQAILKGLGIESYPVLVYAGTGTEIPEFQSEFPSFQFNHVILCVPGGQDTLWLECTSQIQPFNFLGSFTSNRPGLLIHPSGGKLIQLPIYTAAQNQVNRKGTVLLQADQSSLIKTRTRYSGMRLEEPIHVKHDMRSEEQKQWLKAKIPFPNVTVNELQWKESEFSILEESEVFAESLVQKVGKRILCTPNIMNRVTFKSEPFSNRKFCFKTMPATTETDSVIWEVPPHYVAELIPDKIQFSTKFGDYHAEVKYSDDKLLYLRTLKIIEKQFPPTDYKEWLDFKRRIAKADRLQVAFLQKE